MLGKKNRFELYKIEEFIHLYLFSPFRTTKPFDVKRYTTLMYSSTTTRLGLKIFGRTFLSDILIPLHRPLIASMCHKEALYATCKVLVLLYDKVFWYLIVH